ncbi:GPW/gp25 family protein [Pseudoalteromonas sp. S16_S37]|uniref:GPW/gp25 family protein n=1 Tax=Pseudoalteromonas sp. S16_S37 TaxID=2720228 RepID=UPI001680188D|nr:GPW/gp25 family protein [Pseudoalteromonas sp. S16_S37]MBD1583106.1 GPW/gp25 family protein [Pseudoalteromonas sp. S16_S37]
MLEQAFLGTGWGFPVRFRSASSGPVMDSGETLLKQAIHLTLNTLVGERPLWPEMGSGLASYSFADANEQSLAQLRQEIATVLLNHEPRIILESIDFDSSELYDGVLLIQLNYLIRQTNSRSNMVFPFYLTEQSV